MRLSERRECHEASDDFEENDQDGNAQRCLQSTCQQRSPSCWSPVVQDWFALTSMPKLSR